MPVLKNTIINKSTSDNMTILIESVLKDVTKADSPTIDGNTIKWGGYDIKFIITNDIWEFSKPKNPEIHIGKFPSGLGHVSSGINSNINPINKTKV